MEEQNSAAAVPACCTGTSLRRGAPVENAADQAYGGSLRAESPGLARNEAVSVLGAAASVEYQVARHAPVQITCAFVSLLLTMYLTVSVYFACLDFLEYDEHPDLSDDIRRRALMWLCLFVLSLLECGVMIAFLVRQLLARWFPTAPTSSGTGVHNAEGGVVFRSCAARDKTAAKERKLRHCAVLLVLSFVTTVAYLCAFTDPAYSLRHLVTHVKSVWIAMMRNLVFSIFAFAVVLSE